MQELKSYNAADFQRYFNGAMPPKEMHALEKAALDDPFLAEALEGYASLTEEERAAAIADLGKLNFKTASPAPVISIQRRSSAKTIFRVAAAVIVIAILSITGLWISKSNSTQKDTALVVNDEPKLAADSSSVSASESSAVLTDSVASTVVQSPVAAPNSVRPAESITSELKPLPTEALKDQSSLFSDSAAFVYRGDTKVAGKITSPVTAGTTDDVAADSKKEVTAPAIPQKITEETISNNAVASNSNNGYYKQTNTAPVSLESIQRENEVSTEKFETRKKAVTAAATKVPNAIQAIPSVGWESYQIYLKNQIRLDTATRICSGNSTTLQFKVKQSGKIHAVSVLNSSGNKFCDRLAIRLLKDGPAWNPGTDPQQFQQLRVSY